MISFWVSKRTRHWTQKMALALSVSFLFVLLGSPYARASLWEERSRALQKARERSKIEQEAFLNKHPRRPSDIFAVPQECGTIVEEWEGNRENLRVIHIQDAHGFYGAQKNLSRILKSFQPTRSGSARAPLLVMVEGAWGQVFPGWLSALGDRDSLRNVMEDLLRLGQISGEEYLSILSPESNLKLVGAENEWIYKANKKSRGLLQPSRGKMLGLVTNLQKRLDALKQHLYDRDLLLLDRKSREYQNQETSPRVFVQVLKSLSPEVWSSGKYEELRRLHEVMLLEENFYPAVLNQEREKLIQFLSQEAESSLLQALARASLNFRLGKMGRVEYYRGLSQLAKEYEFFCPQIERYRKILEISSGLDMAKILQETLDFKRESFLRLSKNKKQRRIIKLDERIRLAKKFWAEEFDPRDWREYCRQKDQVVRNSGSFLDLDLRFIERHIEEEEKEIILPAKEEIKTGISSPDSSPRKRVSRGNDGENLNWEETVFLQESFYELAFRRDRIMLQNMLEEARKTRSERVILLAGGFHTPGITKLLRQRDISYVVIRPRLECKEISRESRRGEGNLSNLDPEKRMEQILHRLKKLKIKGDEVVKGQIDLMMDTIRNRLFFSKPMQSQGKSYIFGSYLGRKSRVNFALEFSREEQKSPQSFVSSRLLQTIKAASGTLRGKSHLMPGQEGNVLVAGAVMGGMMMSGKNRLVGIHHLSELALEGNALGKINPRNKAWGRIGNRFTTVEFNLLHNLIASLFSLGMVLVTDGTIQFAFAILAGFIFLTGWSGFFVRFLEKSKERELDSKWVDRIKDYYGNAVHEIVYKKTDEMEKEYLRQTRDPSWWQRIKARTTPAFTVRDEYSDRITVFFNRGWLVKGRWIGILMLRWLTLPIILAHEGSAVWIARLGYPRDYLHFTVSRYLLRPFQIFSLYPYIRLYVSWFSKYAPVEKSAEGEEKLPWASTLLVVSFFSIYILEYLYTEFMIRHFSIGYEGSLEYFQFWQIFTYAFLHGSLAAVTQNALAIVYLGDKLERKIGGKHFLQLFFASALAGGISILFAWPIFAAPAAAGPAMGASSAAYAIAVSLGVLFPESVLVPKLKTKEILYLAVASSILPVVFGIDELAVGIAHFAGVMVGLLYPLILRPTKRPRSDPGGPVVTSQEKLTLEKEGLNSRTTSPSRAEGRVMGTGNKGQILPFNLIHNFVAIGASLIVAAFTDGYWQIAFAILTGFFAATLWGGIMVQFRGKRNDIELDAEWIRKIKDYFGESAEVVCTLSSKEMKGEYLKQFEDPTFRQRVAAKIQPAFTVHDERSGQTKIYINRGWVTRGRIFNFLILRALILPIILVHEGGATLIKRTRFLAPPETFRLASAVRTLLQPLQIPYTYIKTYLPIIAGKDYFSSLHRYESILFRGVGPESYVALKDTYLNFYKTIDEEGVIAGKQPEGRERVLAIGVHPLDFCEGGTELLDNIEIVQTKLRSIFKKHSVGISEYLDLSQRHTLHFNLASVKRDTDTELSSEELRQGKEACETILPNSFPFQALFANAAINQNTFTILGFVNNYNLTRLRDAISSKYGYERTNIVHISIGRFKKKPPEPLWKEIKEVVYGINEDRELLGKIYVEQAGLLSQRGPDLASGLLEKHVEYEFMSKFSGSMPDKRLRIDRTLTPPSFSLRLILYKILIRILKLNIPGVSSKRNKDFVLRTVRLVFGRDAFRSNDKEFSMLEPGDVLELRGERYTIEKAHVRRQNRAKVAISDHGKELLLKLTDSEIEIFLAPFLEHPNLALGRLAKYQEKGRKKPRDILVLEYKGNNSFADYMRDMLVKPSRESLYEVLSRVLEIAETVKYMHEVLHIVHTDLYNHESQNILMDKDHTPILVDFDDAQFLSGARELSESDVRLLWNDWSQIGFWILDAVRMVEGYQGIERQVEDLKKIVEKCKLFSGEGGYRNDHELVSDLKKGLLSLKKDQSATSSFLEEAEKTRSVQNKERIITQWSMIDRIFRGIVYKVILVLLRFRILPASKLLLDADFIEKLIRVVTPIRTMKLVKNSDQKDSRSFVDLEKGDTLKYGDSILVIEEGSVKDRKKCKIAISDKGEKLFIKQSHSPMEMLLTTFLSHRSFVFGHVAHYQESDGEKPRNIIILQYEGKNSFQGYLHEALSEPTEESLYEVMGKVLQIAKAIRFLHEKMRVSHRDFFNPSHNILMRESGNPVISDLHMAGFVSAGKEILLDDRRNVKRDLFEMSYWIHLILLVISDKDNLKEYCQKLRQIYVKCISDFEKIEYKSFGEVVRSIEELLTELDDRNGSLLGAYKDPSQKEGKSLERKFISLKSLSPIFLFFLPANLVLHVFGVGVPEIIESSLMGLTGFFGFLVLLTGISKFVASRMKISQETGPPEATLYGKKFVPSRSSDFIQYYEDGTHKRYEINPLLYRALVSENPFFRLFAHAILGITLASIHEPLHARGWGELRAFAIGQVLPVVLGIWFTGGVTLGLGVAILIGLGFQVAWYLKSHFLGFSVGNLHARETTFQEDLKYVKNVVSGIYSEKQFETMSRGLNIARKHLFCLDLEAMGLRMLPHMMDEVRLRIHTFEEQEAKENIHIVLVLNRGGRNEREMRKLKRRIAGELGISDSLVSLVDSRAAAVNLRKSQDLIAGGAFVWLYSAMPRKWDHLLRGVNKLILFKMIDVGVEMVLSPETARIFAGDEHFKSLIDSGEGFERQDGFVLPAKKTTAQTEEMLREMRESAIVENQA